MYVFNRVIACVLMAVMAAACDPVAERRYTNEGAGVDLYTTDRLSQVELQKQYIAYICDFPGVVCNGDWTTFTRAGMNDIDQRCDGFLTWLDARRRDKEPVLAELSAISTAVHSVMTVTGSSPKSLDILSAAFGLAIASYNNWSSRLLISVNQSTVQQIVYKGQGDFRKEIFRHKVLDQPEAMYLLRNYLRLCMPITIEASINTTTTLVLNDAPEAARENLVVANVVPRVFVAEPAFDDSYKVLRAQIFQMGSKTADPELVNYIKRLVGPNVAIGPILTTNYPGLASLRQKISACIVSHKAGQDCPDGSLSQFVK